MTIKEMFEKANPQWSTLHMLLICEGVYNRAFPDKTAHGQCSIIEKGESITFKYGDLFRPEPDGHTVICDDNDSVLHYDKDGVLIDRLSQEDLKRAAHQTLFCEFYEGYVGNGPGQLYAKDDTRTYQIVEEDGSASLEVVWFDLVKNIRN